MSAAAKESATLISNVGPPVRESRRISQYSYAALLGMLVLCASLLYVNTLLNGFVHDDNNEILNNPYVRSFGHLKDIFSTSVLAHLGARGVTNYYRPMSVFGFLVCYQTFGPLAYGFHLANILLHAAVVCMLFGVTDRMFRNRTLAFVAAALFAFHPIHSEAVAWISAVTDLELALFCLLAFWFFLDVAGPGGSRSGWAQLGAVVSLVMALLSKEPAATLPLLATIYEHFYRDDRGDTTWAQKAGRYAPLWLVLCAYLLFRIRFFGGLAAVLLMPKVTWYEAFLSAFALVGQYLGKLLWPVRLSAFYAFHKSVSLLDPRVLGGIAAVASCVGLFVILWKRERPVSFGVLWFFATLAPVLNARWIGPNVFTERYLYLPSVGFCWIVSWAGLALWVIVSRSSPLARRAFMAVVVVLATLGAARTVARNRDWRDEITYYRTTLASEPEAVGYRINLGAVYWGAGNAAAAEREWRQAFQLAPDNAIVLNNLGLVYAGQKRYVEAVHSFQQSMRLRPNYTDAHMNLGRVYAEMGRSAEAESQLRAAVGLAPLNIHARSALGELYYKQGRLAEAEEQFRKSAESEANTLAYDYLGDIYTRWGSTGKAAEAFKQAIALDEFNSRAHFGLAELYEAAGRSAEALREYRAGLQTDPQNPQAQAAVRRLRAQSSHGDN